MVWVHRQKRRGTINAVKGVLERPKQRGIIVFRGDEIRDIKAAAAAMERAVGGMHALHYSSRSRSLRGVGRACNRVTRQ